MKRYLLSGHGRMGQRHKEVADSLGWMCVGAVDPRFASMSTEPKLPNVPLFEALKDVPRQIEFDAVVLAATTASRMGDLEWSLTRPGSHITITEKPLANSLGNALRIQDLAVTQNKPLAVNHQRRFSAPYRLIKTMIDENELGPICSIQVAGSNFGLANNATHFVELATHLFAGKPKSVRAWLDDEPVASHRGIEFGDASGRILVDFEYNRTLFVDFQNRLGHGQTVVLGFEQGQVVVDETRGKVQIDARTSEDFSMPSSKYADRSDYREIFGFLEPGVVPVRRLYEEASGEDWQEALTRSVWAVGTAVAAYFSHGEMNGQEVSMGELPRKYTERIFPWA